MSADTDILAMAKPPHVERLYVEKGSIEPNVEIVIDQKKAVPWRQPEELR